ncbi:MinD/ParA family ATP-binding protein [Actinorugispora endophytica]|uniref:MinD-like ATPase involved in chromosome partitioning or flagellar assembly n=1 Tax=Actinorugispora endophytica TaxID=1605990 RepID=A0A4R6UPT8_9ACTN|nr:MinD/ParA family protein [Actinorugispora endophytica]TDQ49240.1 MinD-like ATPase involved in chromosome partitioning or flagellar assembly [Actinorugispora endophytica]
MSSSSPHRPESDGDSLYPGAPRPPVDAPRPGTAADLTSESLLRPVRRAPSEGWRRAVFTVSGGLINPGDSRIERRRQELRERVRVPVVSGHHRVAVLSMKGGAGKTTTAVGLGSVLAEERGDRVIAVDANSNRGTLADRLPPELRNRRTVRDLVDRWSTVERYSDVRGYTSQSPSRLEFLASGADPDAHRVLGDRDYRRAAGIVERFYSICVTDCGTGMLHPAMHAILTLSDQLVLVCPPSVDGARGASATLDWLEEHGHADLARDSVAVISRTPGSSTGVDLDQLEDHFSGRCRRVLRVPDDPHLEEGASIELARLRPGTHVAYLELAAEIASAFR